MALRKNRRKYTLVGVLVLVGLVVLVVGVTAAVRFARSPLGERMSLVTGTDTPGAVSASPTAMELPTEPVHTEAAVAPEPADKGEARSILSLPIVGGVGQSEAACGGSGSLTVLAIGADFSAGVWPLGADAVRVIKVDFDHPAVTVVAFPRDLWVQTPGLAGRNITQTRLGLAYHEMELATDGTAQHRATAATSLVGQVLYDSFGVEPQAYLTVQMKNLPEMVDAMGGVDITLTEAFTSDRGMRFLAGEQRFDGNQAREYVRTFTPGGDNARRVRQTQFVMAMQRSLLNAGMVTRLPDLAKQFGEMLTTDLTPEQVAQLACMVQTVPQDQITFQEVGADLVSVRNVGQPLPVLDPKTEDIRARLQEWIGE